MPVKTIEAKKPQPVASSKETPSVNATKVVDFVGDVKTELKRITWTSPEEFRTYTKIVIAAAFVLGMGIYLTDLMIQTVLNALNWVFGSI